MKTRIVKTLALAAFALAAWLQPVQAQTTDGSVRFVSYASVGIVHGERIRATVSNSEQSTGRTKLCSKFKDPSAFTTMPFGPTPAT